MFVLILSVQACGSSPPSGPTRVAWVIARDGAEFFVNSRPTLCKTLFRICFIFAITLNYVRALPQMSCTNDISRKQTISINTVPP